MFIRNKSEARCRRLKGLNSCVLLQKDDVPGANIAVTWVEVAPRSAQRSHHHAPEQIYVIIRGQGRMHVGTEEREIKEGDLVYIPSHSDHFAENTSNYPLEYISVASPTFDLHALYDLWGAG